MFIKGSTICVINIMKSHPLSPPREEVIASTNVENRDNLWTNSNEEFKKKNNIQEFPGSKIILFHDIEQSKII